MSLLNEMLNDLNSKPSHRSDVLLMPRAKRRWLARSLNVLAWFIAAVMLGFLVLMLMPAHKPTDQVLLSTLAPVPPIPFAIIPPEVLHEREALDVSENVVEVETALPTDDEAVDDVVVKHNLSLENWHDERLNEALNAIEEGDDPRAVELLTQILAKFPRSIDARENLTALYLSHAKIEAARQVLSEGLSLEPYNLRLSTIKARLLVEEGRHREALVLLEQFNPDIQKSPDYYAVLAAIFNALGRTNEAGSLYQTLLRIDPMNGQYSLGLGIALEHKNAIQQAIEAYTRASQSDGIQPAVRTYAESRLHVLQG